MPVRYGGLGIVNPKVSSMAEFERSQAISQPLVNTILNGLTLEQLDSKITENIKIYIRMRKEADLKLQFSRLCDQLTYEERHSVIQAREKGASSWLTALPLENQGYVLNKREFRDAVALRYGKKIDGIPQTCACGSRNDINHALVCSLGGYTHLRHNSLRDIIADLLVETQCKDVVIEPQLIPVDPEKYPNSTNVQPEARLDIAATDSSGHLNGPFLMYV